MAAAESAGVASPCINVCHMHAATGWCEGCLRTIDEITRWGRLDDAARRQVLQGLSPRRVVWRAIQAEAQAQANPPAAPGDPA